MKSQAGRTAHESMGESFCSFGGLQPVRTPRFDRNRLDVDRRIAGPAVIEDDWSTIVVNPGAAAWADAHGHIHIDVGAPG
jgi:N-methylhydantoinase A